MSHDDPKPIWKSIRSLIRPIRASVEEARAAPDPCRACAGKGYMLADRVGRPPSPAYWFERGVNGEQSIPCTSCDGTGESGQC